MSESNLNAVSETDPGYGQLFGILMRRRFWLLSVLGATLSIAIVSTLNTDPTYQSSIQLLIESNYQGKKGETESQFADSNVEIDYATQINLMRSPLLLERAADLLRPEYPTISVDEIKNSLVLTQVMEDQSNTKIVKAVYTANDPIKAQKVLEAVQKIYQAYNREQQELRLKKGLKFINEQIPAVRRLAAQSEATLEQFRKDQNLIDPEQQAAAIAQALNANEQEQQAIRVQLKDTQARYAALQQQLARSPNNALISSRLSQSSRYQTLLSELQKTDLALVQRQATFTNTDPNVQKLLEQRRNQRELLQQEVKLILGKIPARLEGEGSLLEGQLGGIDLKLVEQLVEVQTNLRTLGVRAQTLAQIEQQLRTKLNRFPGLLAEYNRLQPDIVLRRGTLQQLEKARQELSLEIARGGFDWQVVEEPQPGMQTGPNVKQNLLLGVVVGLMLGGIAAFFREMVDDTVHNSDQLSQQSSLPLLGIIPELTQTNTDELIINLPFGKPQKLEPWTLEVIDWPLSWESLDVTYLNIQLLSSAYAFKSLIVTSARAGEGKSTLAWGLAVSAARLHQRVLLIDADLRQPNLHKQLNLPNEQGLSTLLASDATVPVQSSIQSSGSYINILTAGPMPKDVPHLLSSPRMRELMATFEQTYDLILLDAPPVLGIVDAILAGSFCNGVVLVSRINQVTKSDLMQTKAMLSKLNVIGVVANQAHNSISGNIPPNKKAKTALYLDSDQNVWGKES